MTRNHGRSIASSCEPDIGSGASGQAPQRRDRFRQARRTEIIEAYPVDGARSSAVDYFTGTLSMFDEHGFVEVIRRNDSRPIVRLTV